MPRRRRRTRRARKARRIRRIRRPAKSTKNDNESDTEEGEAEDDAKETDALTGDDDDAHKTAFPDTNDLSFFGGACCCFMAVRLSHV